MKEILLSVLERVGLAWWVEVTTEAPRCTYYFGPFVSSKDAMTHQPGYLEDLHREGAQGIQVEVKRCKPQDLTIIDGQGDQSPSSVLFSLI
jgi:Domain of unknown function (DUF1816)